MREPHEYQICNLKGHLIPLGELPRRVHELDSSHEIVAHCRSGKRSAEAVDFLRKAGFRKVMNLRGGILSWSTEVDPQCRATEQAVCSLDWLAGFRHSRRHVTAEGRGFLSFLVSLVIVLELLVSQLFNGGFIGRYQSNDFQQRTASRRR